MWISFPCKISPGPHLLGHVTIASYICSDQAERHKDDLDDGDPTYLDRACRGRALQTRCHVAATSRLHRCEERLQVARSLSPTQEARLVRTASVNLMDRISWKPIKRLPKEARITCIRFQKQEWASCCQETLQSLGAISQVSHQGIFENLVDEVTQDREPPRAA